MVTSLMIAGMLFASTGQLCTNQNRVVSSLSGAGWTLDGVPVVVPHCWNAFDGCDGDPVGGGPRPSDSIGANSYLKKSAVYRRSLPLPRSNRRYFIRCEGASVRASVRVNGQECGRHVGAFTAFTFEITDALNCRTNELAIQVDNLFDPDTPPINADYTLAGGLYRDVKLIETPEICIDPRRSVRLEPDAKTGVVRAVVPVSGAPDTIQTFTFDRPEMWSPENPKLYTVRIAVGQDSVEESFGFRTVEFREDGFYLNGVKRKLRGVNRHQDAAGRGWAISSAEEERDIVLMKRMGVDALRMAHYPQSPNMYELCDRYGIIVWSEVPAINEITLSERFERSLMTQAREMIEQHHNHPCVAFWGLFNEIGNCSRRDVADGAWESMLERLCAEMKGLDATRPIVAATCIEDRRRLNAISDSTAINIYPRWYAVGKSLNDMVSSFLKKNGRKITAISEYGAGAGISQHQNPAPKTVTTTGRFHPEEYQTHAHVENYREIRRCDRLWGSFVWAFFDFAADGRREGEHDGINDKGLVTRDRETCKDAYYFYKANWNPEPMLHLCGTRMTSTTNSAYDVVAFSNVGAVTLSVNGKVIGTRTPDEVGVVRWPSVDLIEGDNSICICAGELKAEGSVRFLRFKAKRDK